MGRGINNFKLSKDLILSKISQVTIFSVYFDLPVNIINDCIETGTLIKSPIRDDSHPTCGFRYDNRGKLKFKDFAGYFWGDCFDAVALIVSTILNKKLNISNKNDFMIVLQHISFTFKDIIYGGEKDENLIVSIKSSIDIIKKHKPIIELVVREWNKNDINYWSKFNITLQDLNTHFIYPIEQYYIDRSINPEPKYYYDSDDPCYAYVLGKDKHNIYSIKLYFPKRTHASTRFITNCNHLEGIINLRSTYDIIVITKSTKDRVCIESNILKIRSLYGESNIGQIGVINIPHETYRLREAEYQWLKTKLNEHGMLVSLMDNDRTGICEAKWLRDKYWIPPIIIPKKYNAKDFSELIANNNFDTVKELILTTISKIKQYEENQFNSWIKKGDGTKPF